MTEGTEHQDNVFVSGYYDMSEGSLPVVFSGVQEQYVPGEEITCTLEVDREFAGSINKSDWVGLFEEGWQYLFSYLTFVWVTKVEEREGGGLVMTVPFKKEHLPTRDKVGRHQFCYVSRSGDVLGKSSLFVFQNPGLSFTDVDTCLVDESDVTTSVTPAFDVLSLSAPTESTLVRENEMLQRTNAEQESDLVVLRDSLVQRESDIQDLSTRLKDAERKVAAKDKQMQSIEEEQFERYAQLEKERNELSIQLNSAKSREGEFQKSIDTYAIELEKCKQSLADSECVVESMQQALHSSSISSQPDCELLNKCQALERQKDSLVTSLEQRTQQNLSLERMNQSLKQELEQIKMQLRSKDDVITKVTKAQQDTKASLVTLQSSRSQTIDENKRLRGDLERAYVEIKSGLDKNEKMERELSSLNTVRTELGSLSNEYEKLRKQYGSMEIQMSTLEKLRVNLSMGEDMTLVTVRSMETRIAHLESQNSILQAQLAQAGGSASIAFEEREAQLRKELNEFKMGAGLIEKNFKESIADHRSKIVKLSAELDQKNEQLADKGEVIDTLRVECQERRENERYQRVTIDQLRKRLADESQSYNQIVGDLRAQIDTVVRREEEIANHQLIRCPICPAVFDEGMENEMTEHVNVRHLSAN